MPLIFPVPRGKFKQEPQDGDHTMIVSFKPVSEETHRRIKDQSSSPDK